MDLRSLIQLAQFTMYDKNIINRISPDFSSSPFLRKGLRGGLVSFFSKIINQEKLILFAEDNVRDRLDITRIFEESEVYTKLRFVEDGSDLLNYLCKRKGYTSENASTPDLIVFDIGMPDKDSFRVLEEIKKDTVLKQKTIFMFTKKPSYSEIEASFDLGTTISRIKPWSSEENRYIEFFQNVVTSS